MSAIVDPIGDMLTRIRNGMRVELDRVDIPASRIKIEIARILKEENFIKKYTVLSRGSRRILRIELKYAAESASLINGLKRISKPGRRMYYPKKEIPKVLKGFGISILSTSKGIMTGNQARKENVGGELLCMVW